MTVRRGAAALGLAAALSMLLAACQPGGAECSVGEAQAGALSIARGTVQEVGGSTIGLMGVRCAADGPVARVSIVDQGSGAGRELELAGGGALELADGSAYTVAAISSAGGGSLALAPAP